jgi:hypothetical protein
VEHQTKEKLNNTTFLKWPKASQKFYTISSVILQGKQFSCKRLFNALQENNSTRV